MMATLNLKTSTKEIAVGEIRNTGKDKRGNKDMKNKKIKYF